MAEELSLGSLALVVVAYFVPTIISALRRLPDTRSILLLNALLGWTGFGWLLAFWQCVGYRDPQDPPPPVVMDNPSAKTQPKTPKDSEDHDARPAIIEILHDRREAELHHRESGVRVRVTCPDPTDGSSGYGLSVPTASLNGRRDQRKRARDAISDAAWRHYDADTGSSAAPNNPTEDDADVWGFSVHRGNADDAAQAALQLLCTITGAPIEVRVHVT